MRSALILAGGRGERFWPMSRPGRPKQLLPLADGQVLLSATLERLDGLVDPARTFVLTGRDLAPAVTALVGPRGRVIAEPTGRNTAPAVGLAAHLALAAGAEDAMIVLPADPWIPDTDAFRSDVEHGCRLAETKDALVTFGVRPDRPETGYGYLERGPAIEGPWERAFAVKRFREKPDRATAETWVASGSYLWNAGMFAWRPRVILAALEAHRPDLARGLAAFAAPASSFAAGDAQPLEAALDAGFAGLESISIDYAVMEQAANTAMIEAAFRWDDLGSWTAWARRQTPDPRGNVVAERAVAIDSDDCVVLGGGDRPVVVLGGRGLVVVQHEGGTLVCPADRVEEVRKAVSEIATRGWAVREGR